MEQEKVYVSFILEASRPNQKNQCLIKMVVYQKPNKKRYSTEYHATKDDWGKLNSSKLRDDDLKELKKKLNGIKGKAEKSISKLPVFSFVAFEEAFFAKSESGEKNAGLKHWFDKYILKLKNAGRIGTASSYQTTINSILNFKKNLSLFDITPAFLQQYEDYLITEKKSYSTVGIYMRQLRAIINQAINDKILSADLYPFKKYEVPSGQNIKKALPNEDLQKLLSCTPSNSDQAKALDFWILSYLCNGMNMTDIIHLKPENITGDYLHFIREKTKRTKKKDLRPIRVGLNQKALVIIKRQKNIDKANPYLFPILEDGLNPVTIKHRCQRFVKWVNKHMEAIRIDLKIEQKVGTYAARHSFSTVLKRKGAPTSFIKESLGHSSELTTENYLDSFTDDVKLDYAKMLTDL
ncbi:MAG: site-specific integrase [Ferruginibacter sp.]|nr:site-specific integrase [Ferruginibacter sp.]